jgi:hypothetical protein
MFHSLIIFSPRNSTGNAGLSVLFFCFTGLAFTLLTPSEVQPQNTINTGSITPSSIEIVDDKKQTERPMVLPARASMLSATLPGLGQIYNRRYWKVPIIYAGFGALAYYVNFNSGEYNKFRAAYIARVDGNPNTVDDFPFHSTDVLQRAMNIYRRNLEVTYLLAAALYLLNILDANVDAHLMDFDVGESLSMGINSYPTNAYSGNRMPITPPGLTLRINF